jgi:hypothetical protein
MSEEIADDPNRKTIELIEKCIAMIGEHCTSVRLIAVLPAGKGDSTIYTTGSGDFYSQIGAVKEFVIRQDEFSKIRTREDASDDT